MKRSRYSEEQVIAVLKAIEAGAKATDLLRKRGVSEAPLCHWKARYSSTDASFAWRLKPLEGENAKLKNLLAEPMLDVEPCPLLVL